MLAAEMKAQKDARQMANSKTDKHKKKKQRLEKEEEDEDEDDASPSDPKAVELLARMERAMAQAAEEAEGEEEEEEKNEESSNEDEEDGWGGIGNGTERSVQPARKSIPNYLPDSIFEAAAAASRRQESGSDASDDEDVLRSEARDAGASQRRRPAGMRAKDIVVGLVVYLVLLLSLASHLGLHSAHGLFDRSRPQNKLARTSPFNARNGPENSGAKI